MLEFLYVIDVKDMYACENAVAVFKREIDFCVQDVMSVCIFV